MKRIALILLLAPFLLATQCEDDENSGFETTYIIENDTGIDLYLLRADSFLKGSMRILFSSTDRTLLKTRHGPSPNPQ